jgi:hypothetical protein
MRFKLTPPVKAGPLERDIANAIKASLLRRGWVPVRQHSGKFRTQDNRWITVGEPGIADYICLHRDHPAFFLETKREGHQPTDQQRLKQWEYQQAYGLAWVVADTVEKVLAFLEEHERRERNHGSDYQSHKADG